MSPGEPHATLDALDVRQDSTTSGTDPAQNDKGRTHRPRDRPGPIQPSPMTDRSGIDPLNERSVESTEIVSVN